MYPEGSYYFDAQLSVKGPATQAAADIVFVVDESGSMAMEHQWIGEEVRILDQLLKERGLGAGERSNLFALVGFGRNDINSILGITLTQLTSVDNFTAASEQLVLNGLIEDGYAGIDYAVEHIQTRSDTAKQIILLTDEHRTQLRTDLSRDLIESKLREAGYILNVAVNLRFQTTTLDNTSFALGVSNGEAYLFDPFSKSSFTTLNMENVIPSSDPRFHTTFQDYAELALKLGGTAWDLNQLREQGLYAQAFTNAFSQAKVDEVMSVSRSCFECLCLSPRQICSLAADVSIENCVGISTG